MKKFFVALLMLLTIPAFATGVSSTATSADCDNATLDTYSGTSNLQANWDANEINLHWYADSDATTEMNVANASQSCTYDGTLTPPATIPTKTGYTFKGWTLKHKNLFDVNTMLVTGKAVRAGNTNAENPLGSEMINTQWNCTDYIRVSPNTTYTYTIPSSTNANAAGLVFYGDRTVESAISGLTQTANLTRTFTTPANCNYVRFSWYNRKGNKVQLELGSTATDYEPYHN